MCSNGILNSPSKPAKSRSSGMSNGFIESKSSISDKSDFKTSGLVELKVITQTHNFQMHNFDKMLYNQQWCANRCIQYVL